MDIQPIFESLVVCPLISDTILSNLLNAFRNNCLDGIDVTSLSEERLTLLLENGKLPFTDANTEVLNGTPIFANYLITHSDEMLSHISSDLFSNSFVSEKVLTANKFSRSQKEIILGVIPESHLYSSTAIANASIEIVENQPSFTLEENTLIEIINKSTLHDKRLRLVTTIIQDTSDDDDIVDLLKLLGGPYSEIAEREKRPKLDKSMNNEALLRLLRTKGFISSFNEDKDGVSWRVFPPRN